MANQLGINTREFRVMSIAVTIAAMIISGSIMNLMLFGTNTALAQGKLKQRNLSLLKPVPLSNLTRNKSPPNATSLLSGVITSVPKPTPKLSNQTTLSNKTLICPTQCPSDVAVVASPSTQDEPSISVRPGSGPPEHVVAGANDYSTGDSKCGVYTSSFSGSSWSSAGSLPGPFIAGGGTTLNVQGDPVVRHASNGDVFYACLAFNRTVPELNGLGSIYVSRSTTDGSTWGAPVAVRRALDTSEFNDKPWFAIDTFNTGPFRSPFANNIYVCWTQFITVGGMTFSSIKFSRSTDFGNTFSRPMTLSNVNEFISTPNNGCTLDVGSDGSVYVAWLDYTFSSVLLEVRKSTNGGVGFNFDPNGQAIIANNRVVPIPSPLRNNNFKTNSFPSIGVDGNGDVYIVWADNRFLAQQDFGTDILIAKSTDGGFTWTTTVVNSLDMSSTDQFFPTIDISRDPTTNIETIHVFFYDKRYVPNPSNTLIDITEAHVPVGASNIFALTKVTDESTNPNVCAQFFPAPFIGDYIDSRANTFDHVIWTDCRNAATTEQDIFTDSVRP